ncbi:hypothetical protein C9374_003616 [Naegleria lovaniensis]|uniref:Uncharacterized protein n=1 Tax=Naegleria lovaniensis TaxID=51637 RepID=A0AA88H7X4_NAELO|nr:uncharacterized protein C9374_003616 [Naegleria lovaniensis]KAG2393852.1 hypothetical protein C9374_003616 [Naegleria lovaniensis]
MENQWSFPLWNSEQIAFWSHVARVQENQTESPKARTSTVQGGTWNPSQVCYWVIPNTMANPMMVLVSGHGQQVQQPQHTPNLMETQETSHSHPPDVFLQPTSSNNNATNGFTFPARHATSLQGHKLELANNNQHSNGERHRKAHSHAFDPPTKDSKHCLEETTQQPQSPTPNQTSSFHFIDETCEVRRSCKRTRKSNLQQHDASNKDNAHNTTSTNNQPSKDVKIYAFERPMLRNNRAFADNYFVLTPQTLSSNAQGNDAFKQEKMTHKESQHPPKRRQRKNSIGSSSMQSSKASSISETPIALNHSSQNNPEKTETNLWPHELMNQTDNSQSNCQMVLPASNCPSHADAQQDLVNEPSYGSILQALIQYYLEHQSL